MRQILADLGLVTVGDESAWAVISPDDRYRYVLGRTWDDYFSDDQFKSFRPLWVYQMLNPSKARGRDASGKVVDDATIRKCSGFAKRGGAGGFMVVNAFAYSETDPDKMVQAHRSGVDVRGEHNAAAIAWALSRPVLIGRHVVAWGIVPPKLRSLAQPAIVQFRCSAPDCFGINTDGSPKHPLMLSYDTPIVPLYGARPAAPPAPAADKKS